MGNISTFGTYTMARMGIYAAHKAMEITGNNISNINTEGYTRQTIDQFSMNNGGADRFQTMMDTRVGSGAFVAGITQERDQYLDLRYRNEMSSVGAAETRLESLTGVEAVLDEVGRGTDGEGILEARFNEMIEMMQQFNTQGAGQDEFDSMFRSSVTEVVDTFHTYANALENLRQSKIREFESKVDDFNVILTRIQELNTSIRRTQVYGGNALEQQDERNLLLDDLSKYMKVDVQIEKEHLGENKYVDKMVVRTSDQPQRTLVDGIFVTQLSIGSEEEGFPLETGPLTDKNGRVMETRTTIPYKEMVLTEEELETVDIAAMIEAQNLVNNKYPETGTDKDGNTYNMTYFVKDNDPVEGVDEEGYYRIYRDSEEITRDMLSAYADMTGVDVLNLAEVRAKLAQDQDTYPSEKTDASGRTYQYEYELAVDESGRFIRNVNGEYAVMRTTTHTIEQVGTEPSLITEALSNRVNYPNTTYQEDEAGNILFDYLRDEDGNIVYDEAGNPEYDMTKPLEKGTKDGYKLRYEYSLEMDEDGSPKVEPVEDEAGNITGYKYYIQQTEIRNGGAEFFETEAYGSLQAAREVLTKQGVFSTEEQLEADPECATKRGIPFYQKALDVLANTFACRLNEANLYSMSDDDPHKLDRVPLLSNNGSGDLWGDPELEGAGGEPITAANISVSRSWANRSLRVETTSGDRAQQSTANDNLNRLYMMMTNDLPFFPQGGLTTLDEDGVLTGVSDGMLHQDAASKDSFFTGTLNEYFTDFMVGGLATDMNVTQTMLGSYETITDELYIDRDSIMGVDLNDEAMNMMMYQKAFSAACRLMTTFDGLMDKLINGT